MADTYRAWLRGALKWQQIAVIDLRDGEGLGKLLQTAGLKTLGEVDEAAGEDLLKLPGMGIGVVRRVRHTIRMCKAAERRRPKPVAHPRVHRQFPS